MNIKKGVKSRMDAYKNPIYLLYAILSVPILFLAYIVAKSPIGPFETALFQVFNRLGNFLYYPFIIITFIGSLAMVAIVIFISLFYKLYGNAIKVFIAGFGSYIAVNTINSFEINSSPEVLLQNANIRISSFESSGFPSSYVAIATVLALTAYQYLPKRFHKTITFVAFLVAVSRLYLGVSVPIDLVGGFALGLFFGGIVNFIFGSKKFSPVDPHIIKEKMSALGIKAKSVKLAAVDARGSIPYFAKLNDGTQVFIKVVGKENNIADWLFKYSRKILYKRLEDEAPFLNPKRQLEHEAYVSSLALLGGVRTPRVLGIFETTKDRWAHAQYTIDGGSLDRVEINRLTDKVIIEIWEQVEIMHDASIVHRDLRCANVFLDNKNKPWLIDFGFSEGSMPEEAKNRDRAELLASLSTLVGVDRSIKVAIKAIGDKKVYVLSAYLTSGYLSSATSKTLKESGDSLQSIRLNIAKKLDKPVAKPIKLKRFGFK